jgi:hypothetical protein
MLPLTKHSAPEKIKKQSNREAKLTILGSIILLAYGSDALLQKIPHWQRDQERRQVHVRALHFCIERITCWVKLNRRFQRTAI